MICLFQYDFNHNEKNVMLPAPFHLVAQSDQRDKLVNEGGLAFRQDEKTRGLFFLVDGEMELQRFTRAGQMLVIHRARAGETFAEASLFSDHYHCDAVATCDSRLIELDRTAVLKKMRNDAEFSLAIVKRFSRQNQGYRRKLEILAIKNAQERIYTAFLADMLDGNIKAFASDIGLTHEVVYRGLSGLVEKGKLKKTGRGQYCIAD